MNHLSIHNCHVVSVDVHATPSDPSSGWIEISAKRRSFRGDNLETVTTTFFTGDLDTLMSSFRGVFYRKTDVVEQHDG
jgi:hypothetical protein